MDINQKVTEELGVKRWQVDAAVNLIDEGYTIPFISRYRKEVTGSLNDEQLRKLYERLIYLRNLEEKERAGAFQYRGTGEADGRIKAADSCGRDTGFRGGSVPAIPTEASYQGDHRKGKGVRNHWQQLLCCRKVWNHWKRSQKRIFLRRRVLYQRQRLLQGREISLPSPSQITQITGAGSERLR